MEERKDSMSIEVGAAVTGIELETPILRAAPGIGLGRLGSWTAFQEARKSIRGRSGSASAIEALNRA